MERMDVAPGAETDEGTPKSRLAELAERAQQLEGPDKDLKLKALIKQLKTLLADGYNPIVFCRYIPTAKYLAEQLENDPEKKKRSPLGAKTVVRAVTGELSPQQRIERIEALAAEAGEDAAARRVLIATDCLSEGVNLQHHFDAVVHYDLAWNPTRHDQREGRVDRYGQRRDEVRVITLYGDDNGIDGKVLEVLIKKHRQIKKDLGISVSVPDELSTGVTDAIVEWLLMRGREDQDALFSADAFKVSKEKLENDWNSAAERERTSRSRFAQRSIHPEEVAREVASIRQALGSAGEIRTFVRESLGALNAVLRDRGEDFTAQVGGTPVGLQDALASVVGAEVIERDREIPFRSDPAVARGEAALVRTDPVVGALASHVLNAALDTQAEGARPARRCGVITTDAVSTRTTLLLVRYRFHLTLPSRHGERQLVAEDAQLLAFEGAPRSAVWLPQERTLDLLDATASENTDPHFGERTMTRILGQLGDVEGYLETYGDELAAALDAAHRRVRTASGEIVRGLSVTAQKPADILGAYVYLPAASVPAGASA
jgi:hypothetical protein